MNKNSALRRVAAYTQVREWGTHHFPLGLFPTPNWGLNYDPLPYFACTLFQGWLRPYDMEIQSSYKVHLNTISNRELSDPLNTLA